MLSGMTFHVKDSLKHYLKGKAKRILIPYFSFGLASIIVFAVAGNFAADVLNRADVNTSFSFNIIGLLYGNGKNGMMDFNLPLWFLPCIFVTYFFAFLATVFEARAKEKRAAKISLLTVSLLLSFAVTLLDPVPSFPFSIENAVALFPFFYLGTLIRSPSSIPLGFWKKMAIGIGLFSVGIVLALLHASQGIVDYVASAYRIYPLFFIAALLQCCGLILLLSNIRSECLLTKVGRHTLPILVMHKYPVVLLQITASEYLFFGTASLSNPLIALSASFFAIFACLGVERVLLMTVPWALGNSACIKTRKESSVNEERQ